MSRAFVREDTEGPEISYNLPDRDSPEFDEAAAWALLEGWDQGDLRGAELATGYTWGEAKLRSHVDAIMSRAREQCDERFVHLAKMFLERCDEETAI